MLLLPSAQILAIADTNDRQIEYAQEILTNGKVDPSTVTVYKDYKNLMADDTIEAVIIATPNCHHIHVLREAIAAGKHILCEKPMCSTVADCIEVEGLLNAKSSQRAPPPVFWVGMEYRYYPSIARLVKEVDEGTVGKMHMLTIREHRFPFLTKVDNWNRFNANTGGTLVEKCCHFFDLMRHIAKAEPVSVFATGGQSVNHLDEVYDGKTSDILDNAYVIVTFDDGTRAMLDFCMFAEAGKYQEELTVIGDKGKVQAMAPTHGDKSALTNANEPNFRIGVRGEPMPKGKTHLPPEGIYLPTVNEFFEDGGLTQEVIEAGYHGGAIYKEQSNFLSSIAAWKQLAADANHDVEADAKDTNTADSEKGGWKELAAVSATDGTLAVAIGAAAHLSIDEGRVVDFKRFMKEKATAGKSTPVEE